MKLLNLASSRSFWRGIEYHHEKRIIAWESLGKNCYQGKVEGSNGAVYNVMIDTAHPKRSVCNCPFAEGRRVVCKHMVALYLGIFPEKEQQMMDYIEAQKVKSIFVCKFLSVNKFLCYAAPLEESVLLIFGDFSKYSLISNKRFLVLQSL